MTNHRRALLTAALGFLRFREQPAEVATLRRWLDSWAGLGDVITGLTWRGLGVKLRQCQTAVVRISTPLGLAHSSWPTPPVARHGVASVADATRMLGGRRPFPATGPQVLPWIVIQVVGALA